MIIRIRDLDDGSEQTCSVDEFIEANAEADELVEWAMGARPGDICETGGGAQPWVRLMVEVIA